MKKKLKLVVGKSGSGKNYICDLCSLKSIPSYTTRPIRDCEIDGREHIFATDEQWKKLFEPIKDKLPAYTFFNGYHYWTTDAQLIDNDYDAYIIDVDGVDFLLSKKIKRELEVW